MAADLQRAPRRAAHAVAGGDHERPAGAPHAHAAAPRQRRPRRRLRDRRRTGGRRGRNLRGRLPDPCAQAIGAVFDLAVGSAHGRVVVGEGQGARRRDRAVRVVEPELVGFEEPRAVSALAGDDDRAADPVDGRVPAEDRLQGGEQAGDRSGVARVYAVSPGKRCSICSLHSPPYTKHETWRSVTSSVCARPSVLDQRSTTRRSCAPPTIDVVRSTWTGTRSKLVQIHGSGGNKPSCGHLTTGLVSVTATSPVSSSNWTTGSDSAGYPAVWSRPAPPGAPATAPGV